MMLMSFKGTLPENFVFFCNLKINHRKSGEAVGHMERPFWIYVETILDIWRAPFRLFLENREPPLGLVSETSST